VRKYGLFLLLVLAASLQSVAATADYYVAPDGNDNNPGTLSQPFATFDKARQAADTLFQNSSGRRSPIIVQFRGGTYFLSNTEAFTSADSGSSNLNIVYQNYPGEVPLFSGGVQLTQWTNMGGNSWQAKLPSGLQYFDNLWYNGARRLRPRLGSGTLGSYYRIVAPVYTSSAQTWCPIQTSPGKYLCYDRFVYDSSDPITNTWKNLSPPPGNPCGASGNNYPSGDIEATIFEWWNVSKLRVSCVDTKNHIIYFTGPTQTAAGNNTTDNTSPIATHRYVIENLKDSFNAPGQWFLDQSGPSWVLTYLANNGENPNSDTVIVPQLTQLLTLNGTQYVTFTGLSFEHDNWSVPSPGGYPSLRQDPGITAAVSCSNCQNVVFDSLTITQISGGGVEFVTTDKTKTTSNNTLQNSMLYDIGGFGVRVGLQQKGSDTDSNVPQNTLIFNNAISAYGRVIPSGIGIVQGDAHDNTYTHNDIFDGYHSGIEVCSAMCPPGNSNSHGAFNNISSFNHIYNIGEGITDDMGCVYYNTNAGTGNQILNNKCHDMVDASVMDTDGYGGQAYYLDVNTEGVTVENNLAYRISASATAQTCGPQAANLQNIYKNNIFAFFRRGAKQEGCAPPSKGILQFSFTNNIVYYQSYSNVQTMCNDPLGQNDTAVQYYASNLYCYATNSDCSLPTAAFLISDSTCNATNNYTFSQWQGIGQDLGSKNADPMFTNPYYPADDFSLQSGSPATSVGFVPFSLSSPGRKKGASNVPSIAPTFVIYTYEDTTQTTLVQSQSPTKLGDSATFTATIKSELGVPADGELVTFTDSGVTIGTAPLTKGVANFITSSLSLGTHNIAAVYNGDPVFSTSTSITVHHTVNPADSTTVLTSSLNPSNYGQNVTFTATVSSSAGVPDGSITFQQNGTVIGTVNLNSNGVATFSDSVLGVGSHNVIAKYSGSTDYDNSQSSTLVQVVNKTSTTMSLKLSPNPGSTTQSVTMTATVTSSGGIPAGSVSFSDGSTSLGSSSLNSKGVATFTHTFKTTGSHSITANYKGSGSFNTSSATKTETVN
jgi:Bacterial Ig-like domain (group 3)